MVKVQKLNENAKLPERANPTDAGSDLFSVEDVVIQPKSRAFVDTGIAIQATDKDFILSYRKDSNHEDALLNADYEVRSYFRIAPRSGLAYKQGLDVLAGVVDLSYTGAVKVGLYNTSDEPVSISVGDKIAQLIREVCIMEDFVEVTSLESTERGANGFGSTGN